MKNWVISFVVTKHEWRSIEIQAATEKEAVQKFNDRDYDECDVYEGDEEIDGMQFSSINELSE